jgi:tRNA(fMet)-specific endonuclease VapC
MVIDTCIFIEHLRAKDRTTTTLYNIPEGEKLFLSAVTLYELHMGAPTADKKQRIEAIIEDLEVLPFTAEVAEKAGQIYHELKRTNSLIEFRDIFIAATCIVYDQPIITSNKKHFKRIEELKILR